MSGNDQSKVMLAVGLSDSLDSSSEDIIPMQPKRKKRGYQSRKNRNSRLLRPSSLLNANYSYGLCTLIKFVFILFILISLIIGLVVVYSLSKQIDSLHLSIRGIQSNNRDLPDDLHSLHSQLKALEQESTNLKINLNNVIITTSNLTQQTAQLNQKITQLNEAVNMSPDAKLSPMELDEMKKSIVSLRSQIETIDGRDMRSRIDQSEFNGLDSRLKSLEKSLANETDRTTMLIDERLNETLSVIAKKIKTINATIDEVRSLLSKANLTDQLSNKSVSPTVLPIPATTNETKIVDNQNDAQVKAVLKRLSDDLKNRFKRSPPYHTVKRDCTQCNRRQLRNERRFHKRTSRSII